MKSLILNNKLTIPSIGLGTWRSEQGEVAKAVEYALLESRYQHIDCAAIYGNEKEIGTAFKKVFRSDKKRQDTFVTSKLWNTQHHPDNVEAACKQTLADLNLEYLDLYLIHWGIAFQPSTESDPMGDNGIIKTEKVSLYQTWQAMEKLVENGLVRSIGVSNFTAPMLLDLVTSSQIKPVVNQIEIHPYNTQEALVEFCQKLDVQVTAYSPLGSINDKSPRPLEDKLVTRIAKAYGKTPAQILIRWSHQRDLIVIPKSTNTNRIAENIDVYDFELEEKDMKQLNSLNKDFRFVDPSQWWGIPYFK